MDSKWRRFAPFGLYLALLAGLSAIGLYIVQREWNLALQISLALFVIGLAAFAILDPGRLRRALTGRQARYGSNAVIVSIAVLGILSMITYLAYKNDKRWDLTEDKTNSLASETVDTLKELPESVDVVAYYYARTNKDQARLLLENYVRNSGGTFTYQFTDPETDTEIINSGKTITEGTISLRMGEKQQEITYLDEQNLTSALVKLISGETKNVYFVTGHGEKSPLDSGDQSYSMAKTTLENKNYTVKELNLLTSKGIPEDANVLVIAGPTQHLLTEEVQLIGDYLANGGSAIVMEDPSGSVGEDPLVDYVSQVWGIQYGNDVLIDANGDQYFQNPLIAVGGASASSPIITDALKNQAFLFQIARSVSATESTASSTQVEVIMTGNQAWAETDLASLNDNSYKPDQGADIVGSVPIVTTGENSFTNTRIVVVGDSDFGTDAFQSAYGDPGLFINMVDWAAGQDNLISLTPKSQTTRTLNLPAIPYFTGLLYLVTFVIIPGAALVTGIVVFIRRRRKG
jgi:ABC-type uncharacterized transport system involved in gliding motility auxiliary subunit